MTTKYLKSSRPETTDDRAKKIAALLADGMTKTEIARRLGLDWTTVHRLSKRAKDGG